MDHEVRQAIRTLFRVEPEVRTQALEEMGAMPKDMLEICMRLMRWGHRMTGNLRVTLHCDGCSTKSRVFREAFEHFTQEEVIHQAMRVHTHEGNCPVGNATKFVFRSIDNGH